AQALDDPHTGRDQVIEEPGGIGDHEMRGVVPAVASASDPSDRLELPDCAGRHRAQLWSERQGGVAGVQDYSGDEVVAKPGAELPKAVEVFGSDCRGRFDLDPNHLAVPVFQDAVHLDLVVVAVVVEIGQLTRPGQLPGQLRYSICGRLDAGLLKGSGRTLART